MRGDDRVDRARLERLEVGDRLLLDDLEALGARVLDEVGIDLDAVRRHVELAQKLEQLAAAAAEIDDPAASAERVAVDRLPLAHLLLRPEAVLERRVRHRARRKAGADRRVRFELGQAELEPREPLVHVRPRSRIALVSVSSALRRELSSPSAQARLASAASARVLRIAMLV